ncbi:MAG: hypothetical protein WCK86_14795 [Planctomycetia bacterium]
MRLYQVTTRAENSRLMPGAACDEAFSSDCSTPAARLLADNGRAAI